MSTSAPSTALRSDKFQIGEVLYVYATLDSTNAQAAKLLTGFRPKHGSIILADHQSAGRGQIGRTWQSAAGENLCFSVVLYPEMRPSDQFALNMGVSLAVRDTVQAFCPEAHVTVKWPNDVYVEDRKIAGLLIQNTIQGNTITATIAGIGLNVHETDFPEDLPNPTSIRAVLSAGNAHIPERMTVFNELLRRLSDRLAQVGTDRNLLQNTYHKCLYRKDLLTVFSMPGSPELRPGFVRRVDDHGRLVIEWEDGTEGRFAFREVEMIL